MALFDSVSSYGERYHDTVDSWTRNIIARSGGYLDSAMPPEHYQYDIDGV